MSGLDTRESVVGTGQDDRRRAPLDVDTSSDINDPAVDSLQAEMNQRRVTRRVAVLGSTGSIGRATLDVIAASGGTLSAVALTAHSRLDLLQEQIDAVHPRWVVVTGENAEKARGILRLGGTELLSGPQALETVAREPEVDMVVSAIVGSAGLRGTWAALDAGKAVALANKETLVVGGPLVMELAGSRRATLIPVDSEHSAIFQALGAGRRQDVRRVILTASGGPFREYSARQLQQVTVEEALRHPTWNMGPKITVDSATMMNKALEIIEARWLFGLAPEQIDVVIHPQSIVHSMVEFVDGSVIAQLGLPDMRMPIQYALTYPERRVGVVPYLDPTQPLHLDFSPPDPERFPALELGMEVARRGGTCGAVLNGANEAAVAAFLDRRLPFDKIVAACEAVLNSHHFEPCPTLAVLEELDQWARRETMRWISRS
jgi:1-deoxy-D-xylulose-5-phosphate reductoisomerase